MLLMHGYDLVEFTDEGAAVMIEPNGNPVELSIPEPKTFFGKVARALGRIP